MSPRNFATLGACLAAVLVLSSPFPSSGQESSSKPITGLRSNPATGAPRSDVADRAKRRALGVLRGLGGAAAERAETLATLSPQKFLERSATQPPVGPSTIAAPKPGASVPSAAVNWLGNAGGATTAHPGVALLVAQLDGEDRFSVRCTGTLVRQNVVLTAAHCVCYPSHPTGGLCQKGTATMSPSALLEPGRWRAFFQHVGVRQVSQVVVDDDYQFEDTAVRGDIAMLVLSRPVDEIIPAAFPPASSTAFPWKSGWVAGFGFSANPDAPNATTLEQLVRPGLKSQGVVSATNCGTLGFLDPSASLCSLYGIPPGTSQATICGGDSGGPLWSAGLTPPQIGVTSGRNEANCAATGTLAFQMSVAYRRHWDWIARQLAELGSAGNNGRWPAFGENLRFVLDRRNAQVFDDAGNYASEGWMKTDEPSAALATINSSGPVLRFELQDRTGKTLCKGLAGSAYHLPNADYCSAPVTAGQQFRIVAQGAPNEHLQFVVTSHPPGTSFAE